MDKVPCGTPSDAVVRPTAAAPSPLDPQIPLPQPLALEAQADRPSAHHAAHLPPPGPLQHVPLGDEPEASFVLNQRVASGLKVHGAGVTALDPAALAGGPVRRSMSLATCAISSSSSPPQEAAAQLHTAILAAHSVASLDETVGSLAKGVPHLAAEALTADVRHGRSPRSPSPTSNRSSGPLASVSRSTGQRCARFAGRRTVREKRSGGRARTWSRTHQRNNSPRRRIRRASCCAPRRRRRRSPPRRRSDHRPRGALVRQLVLPRSRCTVPHANP